MNIRDASEGILKTHVTWEEFEDNLTKALNTTAKLGPNKTAVDIGEGNVSRNYFFASIRLSSLGLCNSINQHTN